MDLPKNNRLLWLYTVWNSIKCNYLEFKKQRSGYKYYLAAVEFNDGSQIELNVVMQGIKKQILSFSPEELVCDDTLLSEFSSVDVRTITYLSLYKHIEKNTPLYFIDRQYIEEGQTSFILKNIETKELNLITAKKLYQNYELLVKLSKKDMINAISTAVQEQTILDLSLMH